ncbi:unnamed protein product, partial [Prorocentrum cordatum]
ETIGAAVVPPEGTSKMEVILRLQGLLGVQPMIVECPNVMTISLGNPGQVIHPGVTYGKWKDWDEQPLKAKPLFYHGVDDATAEVLEGISDDIRGICRALEPMAVDTSQVKTIFEWYMASYSDSITDSSSLKAAMNTNTAYEGLCHPMKEVDGRYVPDFQFRYLSEDTYTTKDIMQQTKKDSQFGQEVEVMNDKLKELQDQVNALSQARDVIAQGAGAAMADGSAEERTKHVLVFGFRDRQEASKVEQDVTTILGKVLGKDSSPKVSTLSNPTRRGVTT